MIEKQTDVPANEHSFVIENEEQLIEFFRDRDQKKLVLPKNVSYPIRVDHYYAWKESSGVYVYIVFKKPGWKAPVGISFKRTHAGGRVANSVLCDWCLSYGPSDLVGMMSVTLNSRQSLGMMLCLDLGCAGRLEEAAELSGKSFEKLVNQLYERIGRFYDGVLRQSDEIAPGEMDAENVH